MSLRRFYSAATTNSKLDYSLTLTPLFVQLILPSPCTASFQALLVNVFRRRIHPKETCLDQGPHDPKSIGCEQYGVGNKSELILSVAVFFFFAKKKP